MITKIAIQNFKSLKDVELDCSNLNLLSGLNGMGKSSIIQALLLLRQSNDKGFLESEGLTLKGDLINIGVGKDALYQYADKEEIRFDLTFTGNKNFRWNFGYTKNEYETDTKYHDSDVLPFGEKAEKFNGLNQIELFNSHFKYLTAERWVKNQYERSDYNVIQNRNLGKYGEYTTHYLAHFGAQTIQESLIYPNSEINRLDNQVSEWMNEISPGTIVKAEKIIGIDAVKLRYVFKSNQGPTDEYLPTNVGFGMTYILPVIVALLSAKEGDIIIIENPESHLHPQGQSAIGRLIAKVCNANVQVFVETHSDHILNGIRLAVKDGVPADKVKLFFFFREITNTEIFSSFKKPVLDENGRIDTWPDGFFDEWEKTLINII